MLITVRPAPLHLFKAGAILSVAAALALATPGLSVADSEADNERSFRGSLSEDGLNREIRLRFPRPSGGRVLPSRLLLVGPDAALEARLPRRAAPRAENRLPLGRAPGPIGQLFDAPPLIDRINSGTAIGAVYETKTSDEPALVAFFDTMDAYERAVARLSEPVQILSRAPFGGDLISFELPLAFVPVDRGTALAGLSDAPIGVAHGVPRVDGRRGEDARAILALTPPRRDLPRFNLF
ncbi:MAG: hypothetical protein AAF909_10660 [Pseudomonadota bacterium]